MGLFSLVVRAGRVVVCDLVGGRIHERFFELLGFRKNSGIFYSIFTGGSWLEMEFGTW